MNLFVPGAGLVGTTLKWTKNSASGHCKESDDTPFAPVSAPQGPQDAPVVHLLVPGAGPVGHIKSGYGYCYSAQCGESHGTPFVPVGSAVWALLGNNENPNLFYYYRL